MISMINFASAVIHPLKHTGLDQDWVKAIVEMKITPENLRSDLVIWCPVCTTFGLYFKFVNYLIGINQKKR